MIDYNYDVKEKLIDHKIAMDKAYFFLDLGLMIFEKLTPFLLELLKVRIQYINHRKSWQDILNLKSNY